MPPGANPEIRIRKFIFCVEQRGLRHRDAAGMAAAVALELGFGTTSAFGLVASAAAAVFATALAADSSAGTAVPAAVFALLTAVDFGRAR